MAILGSIGICGVLRTADSPAPCAVQWLAAAARLRAGIRLTIVAVILGCDRRAVWLVASAGQ
jgi:hypothetical protein